MTRNYDPRCGGDIHSGFSAAFHGWDDPTLPDEAGDAKVAVSMRGLARLALVASEAGARFQREGVGYDAMAWMLTPRRIFDGEIALAACVDLQPAMRAVMLHGLGMDMDADPDELDELRAEAEPAEEDGLDEHVDAASPGGVERTGPMRPVADVVPIGCDGPRLFTAIVVDQSTDEIVHAFEAVVAPNRVQALSRIRSRHGDRIAEAAEIREGFDPSIPMIEALVSPAVSDMLTQVSKDPSSPLARGLEVAVVQRFAE